MLKRLRLRHKEVNGSQSTIDSAGSVNEVAESLNHGPVSVSYDGYHINEQKIKKELPFKIHRAVWKSNDEKLEKLLEETDRRGNRKYSTLNIDRHKRTALHLAVCKQNLHIVDLLLDSDGMAALLMQDDEGNNPLHKSIECDKFVVTIKLTELPFSKEAVVMRNYRGRTPLHFAAQRNDVKGANKLLDAGACVDDKDNDGHCPLALAVLNCGIEFIDLMKKEKAMADVTNEKGETPLTHAVRANNLEMVKQLLTFPDINPALPDDARLSPLDYAKQLNYTEIYNEMKRNMTEPPEFILPSSIKDPDNWKVYSDSESEDSNPPQIKEDRETFLERIKATHRATKLPSDDVTLDSDDLEILAIGTGGHYGKLKDPPSSSKDEEEAKEVEEENEQPTSIVTKEAEDPKQEKSGANIHVGAPPATVKERTALEELLEKSWDTTEEEEEVIPKKKENPPKPLPGDSTDYDEILGEFYPNSKPVHLVAAKEKTDLEELLEKGLDANEEEEVICKKKDNSPKPLPAPPVVAKDKTDLEELLEKGWDTTEEEEEVIPKKTYNSPKPLPAPPVADKERTDLEELLEKGWDTTEEEEEVVPKKNDNLPTPLPTFPVAAKERTDLEELIEKGWDTDSDSIVDSNEDVETTKYNPSFVVNSTISPPTAIASPTIGLPTSLPTIGPPTIGPSIIAQSKSSVPSKDANPPSSSKPSGAANTPVRQNTDLEELLDHGWDSSDYTETESEKGVTQTKHSPPVISTPVSVHGPPDPLTLSPVAISLPKPADVSDDVAVTLPIDNNNRKANDVSDSITMSPVSSESSPEAISSSRKGIKNISPKTDIAASEASPKKKKAIISAPMITDPAIPLVATFSDNCATPPFGSPTNSMPTNSGSPNRRAMNKRPSSRMQQLMVQLSSDSSDEDSSVGTASPTAKYRSPTPKLKLPHRPPSTSPVITQRQHMGVRSCSPSDNSPLQKSGDKYMYMNEKYERMCKENRNLEKAKMNQDAVMRQLQQRVEQLEEDLRLSYEEKGRLIEEIDENELKMANLLKEKQSAELNCKEMELQGKTDIASLQQTKEELDKAKGLMLAEREDNTRTAATLNHQKELYKKLQSDMSEQLNKMAEQLRVERSNHDAYETQISELQKSLADTCDKLTQAMNDKAELQSDLESTKKEKSVIDTKLSEEKINSTCHLREKQNLEVKIKEMDSLQQSITISQGELRQELEATKKALVAEQEAGLSKDSELSNHQNMVLRLRREIDEERNERYKMAAMLESTETTKTALENKVSDLECQSTEANSKLATELSSRMELMKNIGVAEKMLEEKQTALEEERENHKQIVENLTATIRKVECEGSDRLEQIISLKEKLASNKTSKAALEKEMKKLKKELLTAADTNVQLQDSLQSIQRNYDDLSKGKAQVVEVIEGLSHEATVRETELEETRAMARKYQQVVKKAKQTLKLTVNERDEATAEQANLQSQIVEFESKVNAILIELDRYEHKEKHLTNELERTKKSHSSLQDMATRLRGDVLLLENELDEERVRRERAETENAELREIWDSEVKGKHKLTEKIMKLEKDSVGQVPQSEIEKTKRERDNLQMNLNAMQEKNGILQREFGKYRANLKEAKKQIKKMEQEWEIRRDSDIHVHALPLHQKVLALQELIKSESAQKLAEQERACKLEQDLKIAQDQLLDTKQELNQVTMKSGTEDKRIITLTDDLNTLQDQLSLLTVAKDKYMYDAVSQDLEESNLENQKLSQDILDIKEKLSTVLTTVNRLKMGKASADEQTSRFRDLLDSERAKRATLMNRMDRSKDGIMPGLVGPTPGRLTRSWRTKHCHSPPNMSTGLSSAREWCRGLSRMQGDRNILREEGLTVRNDSTEDSIDQNMASWSTSMTAMTRRRPFR